MKGIEKVLAVSAGILLFLSAGAWAQPVPAAAHSAKGQKSASAKKKKREKPKKWQWHGQLVDAPCMEKTLHRKLPRRLSLSNGTSEQGRSAAAGDFGAQLGEAGAAGSGYSVMGRAVGSQAPTQGIQAPNGPSFSTHAMQRAARLEHAAKECTATRATSQFGFLTDIDAIVKFGKIGNSKAIEAIKPVELKPKKPVEATIQGFQPSKGRFLVTSVAVKGKHKK